MTDEIVPEARANEPGDGKTVPEEIEFHFIKGNAFRVIYADGIFGGIHPNGRHIHMSLFNERQPIPQRTVNKVTLADTNEDGQVSLSVGEEVLSKRISREGIVREIEADVVLDIPTASNLVLWLHRHLDLLGKSPVRPIKD